MPVPHNSRQEKNTTSMASAFGSRKGEEDIIGLLYGNRFSHQKLTKLWDAVKALRSDDSWYRDGLKGWSEEKRDAYALGFAEAADYIEDRMESFDA